MFKNSNDNSTVSSHRAPGAGDLWGLGGLRSLGRPTLRTTRAQVVVVGSGAGGAVVARELAEEGYDVVILEEGGRYSPDDYGRWRPSQTMRRLGRLGGSTVAMGLGDSPAINILSGKCVGGSSVMTGGVCFRIPAEVHEAWTRTLGVEGLSQAAMRPHYERVEGALHVEEVPAALRSRSTVLFGEGAARLDHALKPLRRNTKGCTGSSRCNFGCPNKAKMSVDLNYLPRAEALGARVLSRRRVERLLVEGDRIVGVAGVALCDDGRRVDHRFEVRADAVVLAAGTLHTPLILMKSRLGRASRQLGRNLTLHPAFRVCARFDERVEPWRGAMQSAYVDGLDDERLILISAFAPVSIIAGGMPGVGPEFMARVRRMSQFATFGGMVHDDASGRVRRGLGREPLVTYRLSPRDRAALLEGVRVLGACFLEAGARELVLPVFGAAPVTDVDALRRALDPARLSARRLECLSFHPLGTCRMSVDPRQGVVDPGGRVHGLQNLWVADGSVFPSSVGVNTQIPVMAMATRIAFEMLASGRLDARAPAQRHLRAVANA